MASKPDANGKVTSSDGVISGKPMDSYALEPKHVMNRDGSAAVVLRTSTGQWAPGFNPRGYDQSKQVHEFRKEMRKRSPRALEILDEMLADPDIKTRAFAMQQVFDRGFGKPQVMEELTEEQEAVVKNPLQVSAAELTAEELEALDKVKLAYARLVNK